MKVRARGDGNTGQQLYRHGQQLEERSEFVLRQLANGVFQPLDEEAAAAAASEQLRQRYASPALRMLATELNAADAAASSTKEGE